MIRQIKSSTGIDFDEGDLFQYELRPKNSAGVFTNLSAIVLNIYNTQDEAVVKGLSDFTLDTSDSADHFYYYRHQLGPYDTKFVAISSGDVVAVDQILVKAKPIVTSV